jgi:hypothetical protein
MRWRLITDQQPSTGAMLFRTLRRLYLTDPTDFFNQAQRLPEKCQHISRIAAARREKTNGPPPTFRWQAVVASKPYAAPALGLIASL